MTPNSTPPTGLIPFYLYKVTEAGRLIGYGQTRTREFIKEGLLPAVLVGTQMRVPGWAIEEFVRSLPTVHDDAPQPRC